MEGYYKEWRKPTLASSSGGNVYLAQYLHRTRWWANFAAGMSFFVFLGVLGIAALGIIALTNARYKDSIASVTTSGQIPNTPYKIRLDGASALAMTLPNDLSGYVGATYVISAGTAQTHTVTIQPGIYSTTFDGTNTIASWGGAVGDLIQIEVIGKDRIVVTSNVNVAFS